MNHIANLFPSYQNSSNDTEKEQQSLEAPEPQVAIDMNHEPLLEEHSASSREKQPIDSAMLLSMIEIMESQLSDMKKLLQGSIVHAPVSAQFSSPAHAQRNQSGSEEVFYGTFTGEAMLSESGQSYPISPNYASKSKLIEGDTLKLTIEPSGRFVYKQVEMTPRAQTTGKLAFDAIKNQWLVFADGKNYNILTASVTFHKGEVGDEAHIITPTHGGSWAAIEYIQK